jgi:hypothetical protein
MPNRMRPGTTKFSHAIAGHPSRPFPSRTKYIPHRLLQTWVAAPGPLPACSGLGLPCGRRYSHPQDARGRGSWGRPSGRAVRISEFWTRMRAQFGDAYASSVAKDHVLSTLGERTVDQALADGVEAKTVWRAVCKEFDVPPNLR